MQGRRVQSSTLSQVILHEAKNGDKSKEQSQSPGQSQILNRAQASDGSNQKQMMDQMKDAFRNGADIDEQWLAKFNV